MVSQVVPVEPFDLIVFGATGDLAQRKLIPALYHRLADGQMPDTARIIGVARTAIGRDAFRAMASKALDTHVAAADLTDNLRRRFLDCVDFVRLDVTGDKGWDTLRQTLEAGENRVRAFYMSVAPRFFGPIARGIKHAGLADGNARIVVEKPLGHDLESARALNRQLGESFSEAQIYRIDHYLGKETVQNLMALRFANTLFEPLWNAQYIDHVQITVAENVGIEGRGPYYDTIGAMRDMVQNHILQLVCLIAMEPPSRFEPDAVRDEKLKVLKALEPLLDPSSVVRGQYRATGNTGSYRQEAENPDSHTESFIALKLGVSNWRWAGVPFYLRTGKRLRNRLSEIVIQFRHVPHSIFQGDDSDRHSNVLAIRLQPDEGITLSVTIKDPGPGGMRLTDTQLDMSFSRGLKHPVHRMPDAYERLVMDVIRGDQTLFMRGDEVEAAWHWSDGVIHGWNMRDAPRDYDSGSSGPEDALMLMHRDGRRWREITT